jgi:hypothetical protein
MAGGQSRGISTDLWHNAALRYFIFGKPEACWIALDRGIDKFAYGNWIQYQSLPAHWSHNLSIIYWLNLFCLGSALQSQAACC